MSKLMAENGASESSESSRQAEPAAPVEDNARNLPVDELPSQDQVLLLGAIDSLRQEHLAGDIGIPQIVVCGDQSCGKSSVLEAISGVSFPASAETTTRFATEVILRKSDEEATSVRVIASADRSAEERTRIQNFQTSAKPRTPQDFKNVIQEAYNHLRRENPSIFFWEDWLRVEIFGPNQPHLTLVDLPGIIHHESENKTNPGDANKILDLVRSYVRNPRTTVLAIVSALNNNENQEIIGLTSKEAGDRTLGILTKVDMLEEGSEGQNIAVSIARDQRDRLGLGWHVLINQRHDLEGRSSGKRDEAERAKLSLEPWSQVDPERLGVQALRKRLSKHLFRTISLDLNRLVKDMERQRDQLTTRISQLGQARSTIGKQKQYLAKVLEKFSRLIEDGLEENFGRHESEEFFGASEQRQLRYAIRNETDAFANRMRKEGRQYHIFLSDGGRDFVLKNDELGVLPEDEELKFSFPYTPRPLEDSGGRVPIYNVPLKRYCATLSEHIGRTRGKDLRGISMTKNVRDVFRQLSVPWEVLAKHFAQQCFSIVVSFLKAACYEAGGEHTGAALLQTYVLGPESRFHNRRENLNGKMEELLWPYTECHPMTSRLDFNAASAFQTYTDESRGDKTWADIARDSQRRYTMEMIEAADVLVQTESSYKIALDNFVDNVASLGIEMCLLRDLSKLVEPSEVHMMEDELVSKLAAESPEVAAERETAERQVAVLNRVIATCAVYRLPDPAPSSTKEQALEPSVDTPGPASTQQGGRPASGSGTVVNGSNQPDSTLGDTNITPTGSGTNVNPTSTGIHAKPGGRGSSGSAPSNGGISPNPNSNQNGTSAAGAGAFGSTATPPNIGSSTMVTFGAKNPSPQPGPSTPSFSGARPTNGFGSPMFNGAPQQQGKSTTSVVGNSGSEQSQSAEKSGPFSFGGFGSHSNAGKSPEPLYYTKSKGTAALHFTPFTETERDVFGTTTNVFQHLGSDPCFSKFSAEELRLDDYNAGRTRPKVT